MTLAMKLLTSFLLVSNPQVDAFAGLLSGRHGYNLEGMGRGARIMHRTVAHASGVAMQGAMSMDFVTEEVAQIKNQILQVAAATERGNLASKDQREDVELLVGRLSELTLDSPFTNNEDMLGAWMLVYSSSQAFRSSPFFATFQALIGKDGLAERIFTFTDGFPNAKIGQARQIVDGENMQLVSRVEMSLWPHRYSSTACVTSIFGVYHVACVVIPWRWTWTRTYVLGSAFLESYLRNRYR
ncbi:unnamed protein product [Choristocarpus tenellus]